jgi:hypothetical protein
MNEEARASARNQLSALVNRIMDDGQVDAAEREDLRKVFRMAVLTPTDVRQVFTDYLEKLRQQVVSDGAVTELERQRCQAVVDQLRIPLRLLPQEVLDVVLGKKDLAAR